MHRNIFYALSHLLLLLNPSKEDTGSKGVKWPTSQGHKPHRAEARFEPRTLGAHLHHLMHRDFLVQEQLITEALFPKEPLESLPRVLPFLLPVPLGLQAVFQEVV